MAEFRLAESQSDGKPLRWHLQVLYDATGVMPKEMVVPPLPEELRHLWQLFWKLGSRRQNGMVINPLSSVEILAWEARRRIRFEPWEHDIIDRLDSLYVASQNRRE